MSLCIVTGAKVLSLATALFSLSWTHSVEKVTWQEDWQVTTAGLVLSMARVKGSGAGMEPGENAILENGWWQWKPDLSPQAALHLAASGATDGGWTLCTPTQCLVLAEQASETIVLRVCD